MDIADKKILISIPCRDDVPVRFIETLLNLQKPCTCMYRFGTSGLVYDARDEACQIAISNDYDYILFIDSDMVVEPRALVYALKREADIVTGLYFKRKDNHEPVLYKKIGKRYTDENGTIHHSFTEVATDLSKEFFEVEGCGFGFVLIRTEVLKTMHKKYLSWFEPLPGMGEDLSFCERCKDFGFKIMCDTSIYLGHMGTYVYDFKDWIQDDNTDGIKVEWNKEQRNGSNS